MTNFSDISETEFPLLPSLKKNIYNILDDETYQWDFNSINLKNIDEIPKQPYKATLNKIDPRIVSAVIGKGGSIHKNLVKNYNLRSIHISQPEYISSHIERKYCKIILTGYNRNNIMKALNKIIDILTNEQQFYIDIDYKHFDI